MHSQGYNGRRVLSPFVTSGSEHILMSRSMAEVPIFSENRFIVIKNCSKVTIYFECLFYMYLRNYCYETKYYSHIQLDWKVNYAISGGCVFHLRENSSEFWEVFFPNVSLSSKKKVKAPPPSPSQKKEYFVAIPNVNVSKCSLITDEGRI